MRRLFTILFTATLFVSQSFGQMVVKGDVVNVGDITSDVPVQLSAAASGATGINGKITNTGTLNLKGGITYVSNEDNDGLLFNDYTNGGTVDFTGTTPADVKVVKTFTRGKRYLVSFPFSVGNISVKAGVGDAGFVLGKDYAVWSYDTENRAKEGGSGHWKMINNITPSAPLEEGIGYAIMVDDETTAGGGSTTLVFSAANQDAIDAIYPAGNTYKEHTLTFYSHSNTIDRQNNWGWNVLGTKRTANYIMTASHLPYEGEHAADDLDAINFIYLYDANTNTYDFRNLEMGSSKLSPYKGYFAQIGGGDAENVPSGSKGNLKFHHIGLTHDAGERSLGNVDINSVELSLQGEGSAYSDNLRVNQSDRYHNKFSLGEDASKMFGDSPSISEFYTLLQDIPMVDSKFKSIDSDIPVGLRIKDAGNYTINISDLLGFEDTDIYLIDKAVGKSHNLLEGDYTFQANTGTIDDRFALHFGSVTAIHTPNSQINVFVENNEAHVKNIKVGDTVSIYNIGGQLISQGVASSSEQSYRLAGTGVYVVKVTGSESYISKIISK